MERGRKEASRPIVPGPPGEFPEQHSAEDRDDLPPFGRDRERQIRRRGEEPRGGEGEEPARMPAFPPAGQADPDGPEHQHQQPAEGLKQWKVGEEIHSSEKGCQRS
jgi:hypothetical protein